jgi:hypothetical protein
MKTFLGKTVDREQLVVHEADIYAPGEFDSEFAVAEVFLWDFECNGMDSTGRNAYSIQLSLDADNRIAKIERIGHCHMCHGQGSDDDLKRFPHSTLEEEAHQVLTDLLSNVL